MIKTARTFYCSFPVIEVEYDSNNPNHVALLSYRESLVGLNIYTKYQTNKCRKLMKLAGLVCEYGDTGECSIHQIDLSIREFKYDDSKFTSVDDALTRGDNEVYNTTTWNKWM